jgi:ribosome-binding protein aMBF1 (putative translation factor)
MSVTLGPPIEIKKPIPRCPADVAIDVIRQRIKEKGSSQAKVAYAIGSSPNYLNMVLAHEKEPSMKYLRKLWIEVMR